MLTDAARACAAHAPTDAGVAARPRRLQIGADQPRVIHVGQHMTRGRVRVLGRCAGAAGRARCARARSVEILPLPG
eukprot:6174354-Prymnesium_polylepis.1